MTSRSKGNRIISIWNRTNPISQNKGVTARFSVQLESNGIANIPIPKETTASSVAKPLGAGQGLAQTNDRIIATEQDAHSWADIKPIDDLGKEFCHELEEFFINYHKLSGKKYRVLDVKGPDQARKLVKAGRQ